MPRHTHLMRRGSRYYLNVKVPKDLRRALGKEIIRKSLDTSDPSAAVKKVRFESCKLDEYFQIEREKLQAKPVAPEKRQEISDQEMHSLVYRFFIGLESESEKWWHEQGRNLPDDELDDMLYTLGTDEDVYLGGSRHYREAEGNPTGEVEHILEQEGVDLPRNSASYKKLISLFRKARLENVRRSQDRINRQTVRPREPIFREVYSHTAPPKRRVTLGEMLDRYKQALTDTRRKEGTRKTYELPARLLREVFGKKTPVDEIRIEGIERLLLLLKQAPSNASKKYKGMTLEQAIKAADREGNDKRLAPKTLGNYFNNISAIFNFAVEKKMITENPAKDRYLRATYVGDDDEEDPHHYSDEELNKIFNAPLYTGCVDDGRNYRKAGPNKPRRGRFWVPLLALFHGFRCNEIAQLYTEDFCDTDGIEYFEIRELRADGSKCEKHLKSKQSKRRVPLHPELKKIGFLEYVAERRRDSENPRLFPDLPIAATGYYSDSFSKWYARFKQLAVGVECQATFHSFRHHFRTALGENFVSNGDVDLLGGWDVLKRSSERRYDRPTIQRLFSHIEKVHYDGLDLSHLYV